MGKLKPAFILAVAAIVVAVGAILIIMRRASAPGVSAPRAGDVVPAPGKQSALRIEDDVAAGISTVYYKDKKLLEVPNGWGQYGVGEFRLTERHAYIYSCFKQLTGYYLFGLCPRRLMQVNLDSGEARNVIDGTRAYYDLAEDISPDEELVVMGRSGEAASDPKLSIVFRAIGSEEEIVYPVPGDGEYSQLGDIHFSPDGTRAAYALARGTPGNEAGAVYTIDIETGSSTLLAATDAPNTYFRVKGWKDNNIEVDYVLTNAGPTPASFGGN